MSLRGPLAPRKASTWHAHQLLSRMLPPATSKFEFYDSRGQSLQSLTSTAHEETCVAQLRKAPSTKLDSDPNDDLSLPAIHASFGSAIVSQCEGRTLDCVSRAAFGCTHQRSPASILCSSNRTYSIQQGLSSRQTLQLVTQTATRSSDGFRKIR